MKYNFTKLLFTVLLVITQSICGIRPASAEIVQNTRDTVPFQFYNDCTGEWVEGTAEVHLIWIINAGKIDSIHTNVHGTAIGQTTGNRYIFQNNYKDDFSNFVCGGTATSQAHQRLISLGKSPNLSLDLLVTYSIDVNCNELPPVVTVVGLRCK